MESISDSVAMAGVMALQRDAILKFSYKLAVASPADKRLDVEAVWLCY